MKVHDRHDKYAIGTRLVEKRVGEPRNDDSPNAATEWPTNFGKLLNLGVGSFDE